MEKFITLSKLLLIIFGVTLSISNNESSSIISSKRGDRDLKNDGRFLFGTLFDKILGDDNDSNSANVTVETLKAKGRSDVEITNDNSRIFRDDKVQGRFLFGLFDLLFSDDDEDDDCITAPSAATSTQPASISISSSAPTTTSEVTTPAPTNGTRSKTNF